MSRQRGRKRRGFAVSLFSLTALCLSVFVFLSDFKGSAATEQIQLVRLNITTADGLVKIEIIADGSFDEATVQHFTRGNQTVFRVIGARSLLKQSYEINETVAHDVKTLTGETDGAPYVDVMITLGDGATVAQRKSFNRLVIGVASDFARLRHPSSSNEMAKARSQASKPQARVAATNSPVVVNNFPAANNPANELASLSTNQLPAPNNSSAAISDGPTIFNGRTIWPSLPTPSFQFSRSFASGLMPLFFVQQTTTNTSVPSVTLNFINMTIEPPGMKRGVWIPGTTAADKDEVGGRALGSGFIRPSFLLGAAYDDNYFYRSTVGRNLGIFTFAPRIEFELPGVERALRLAYEARLRRLSNGNWANGQTFDFDSRFDPASYIRIALRDHFVRSALDPREYDPAGEVYIVGDTFNRNDAALRVEYKLSERNRVAIDGGYNLVRWSDSHILAAPEFINYNEAIAGGAFERDISPATTLLATFTFTNGASTVPLRPRFNDLNDYHRYDIEVGARTQMTDTSGAALRIGFERSVFLNAPAANDFSGLVFDLRYRRDLTPSTNFELAALRNTQVSAFNLEGGNARLLSTGGEARVETNWTESLKLGLSINYQQLGFPVAVIPTTTASGGVFVGQFAGERRKDHLYGFSFEAGYTFSELLKTRFVYTFSRRDSTIPVFTFNRNRLSLVFEIGRRNDVRGRPF
ncbi:MAG TPA: hypothetical protein VF779_09100 [Pyrinomonadaceae bacterium]